MADAQIAHARHFLSRFAVNGVPASDFEEVLNTLDSWDDWCRAWSARAAVHERLGLEALDNKRFISAAEHLSRAAATYHFAKYLFVTDMQQMRAAHMKSVKCLDLALPHLDPPGERVLIPYEGKHLVGTLRKPKGIARPPIVLMTMGLDSCKEELLTFETTFLERGMAILAFDGPGQGEAEYDFPIRGDYEIAVTVVLDWLETRRDVDTARIGLWGVSLGGYYAPRACAFEKRIKACIALAGPYDWLDIWDKLPDLTRAAFRLRSHAHDEIAARQNAATLSLKGIACQIECPIFIVSGRLDRIVPPDEAERLAREVKGPCELLIIPDGNHVANNRPYRYRPQTADWMAERLGVATR